jgi:hypothetical protein
LAPEPDWSSLRIDDGTELGAAHPDRGLVRVSSHWGTLATRLSCLS